MQMKQKRLYDRPVMQVVDLREMPGSGEKPDYIPEEW